MNKTYLSIAGVAVAALVGFGILTQNQGDQAENILSNLQNSTSEFASDVATNVEQGFDATVESVQEVAADAEAMADDAYQAAVEDVLQTGDELEASIEPAAGDATTAIEDTTTDVMNAVEDTMTEIETQIQN